MPKTARKNKKPPEEVIRVVAPQNTASPIVPDESKPAKAAYFNRELSWLDFDSRVLALAKEKSVPLAERIKFAAIFGSGWFQRRSGSGYKG